MKKGELFSFGIWRALALAFDVTSSQHCVGSRRLSERERNSFGQQHKFWYFAQYIKGLPTGSLYATRFLRILSMHSPAATHACSCLLPSTNGETWVPSTWNWDCPRACTVPWSWTTAFAFGAFYPVCVVPSPIWQGQSVVLVLDPRECCNGQT